MRKESIKTKKNKVRKILKTDEKIEKVQKLANSVESLNRIISETLYIQKGIAIDIKNFTLMSVPNAKELLSSRNNL